MRIKTDIFKKYYNLLNDFYSKGIGIEYTEGLYFDFINKFIYFQNKMNNIYGRFQFEFEEEEGDNINNFYINIKKFLNICLNNDKDFIYLDNDYVFFTSNSTYKLNILKENDFMEKELFIKETDFNINISFNEQSIEELKKASKYCYRKTQEFDYKAIYIHDGYIYSMMADQIYEGEFNFINKEPIIIYNEFAHYIYLLGENTILKIGNNFDKLILDTCEIIMPKINIDVPPIREDWFIERYNKSNEIVFQIDELALAIAILSPYWKSDDLKKLTIKYYNKELIFQYQKQEELIIQKVVYESIQDIDDGFVFLIDGENLKKAIDTIQGNFITCIFNLEGENQGVKISSDVSLKRKIILSVLKD